MILTLVLLRSLHFAPGNSHFPLRLDCQIGQFIWSEGLAEDCHVEYLPLPGPVSWSSFYLIEFMTECKSVRLISRGEISVDNLACHFVAVYVELGFSLRIA